jgi:uncharacterized protein (TIGR03083 family)
VQKTLDFPALLRLIDERSTAFCAAIASAPSLDVQVPTCPEWTLLELAQHVGDVRRRWAAIVTAGPDAAPPAKSVPEGAPTAPREREDLLAWLAAATREFLDALREAGPDRGCWAWWDTSQSPQTVAAVARHQVQELAVHTYDAQLTVGAPQPLPDDVALDGVDEFLSTCVSTTVPWPHEAAAIEFHATEGGAWHLALSADGARVTRLPDSETTGDVPADVCARGTASEIVLVFYDRSPIDSLRLDGDGRPIYQLSAWDPDA